MKFIHAADIHLDSPLRGLSNYPDAPAKQLRTATRDAFLNLVSLAIEAQVDFMVIAGDVYDGDWKDFNTGLFFVKQMGRLRQANIPVYLLYGNHDAESEMTRSLTMPDNVHVFSAHMAETFQIPDLKVALHGQSFKVAGTEDNLLPGYPEPVAGWLNIGVLHTALEGNSAHARYAPCSRVELKAKGYQYWALGHVHEHSIERGDVTIAFPGNLQGRHIREPGARGALLVTAEGDEITRVDRVETDVLRWHLLEVDISRSITRSAAITEAGRQLESTLARTPAHLRLAVRVQFTGRSEAHSELLADERQLRHEIIGQAISLDSERLWIEKVTVNSEDASSPGGLQPDEAQGALSELASLALKAQDDPAFIQSLEAEWRKLLDSLPHDVVLASPELRALKQDSLGSLPERLRQTTPMLLARVAQCRDTSTSST